MKKIILLGISALMLAACTGEDIPESSSNPSKARTIYLKREYQRVRRYDCDGKLVSDKIETVRSPVETVELRPSGGRSFYDIQDSTFANKRTNSSPAVIDHIKFQVDYEDTWLNMKVRSGLNEISYKFVFENGEVETGSRYITVTYEEERLSGKLEYHPSEFDCSQP